MEETMRQQPFILMLLAITVALAMLVSCKEKPTVPDIVASPVFDPPEGTYWPSQTVSITCSTIGASIVYTTDGSNPTSASPVYTAPLAITATTTIKAQAYRTGWTDSPMVTAVYTIQPAEQVATPVFDPVGGVYSTAQTVTIDCATSGATIRYTTDGTEPGSSSALYQNPINVSATTTIKALGFKDGWTPSAIASATYTIGSTPGQLVFVPGGTFNNGTSDSTISSFYIDKYELTQVGYQAVMGTNPSYFSGVTDGPVEQVSWFNAIEYCNRRSPQEGLTPCYIYSTYGSNPDNWPSGWNSLYTNHTNVSCN